MSLRYVLFDLNLFPTEAERPSSQKRILCLLEALTCINQFYLKEHPETPFIYKSGIEYKVPAQFDQDPNAVALISYLRKAGAPGNVLAYAEDVIRASNGERFRDIGQIIANGGGDCDNVACWRAAELRNLGIKVNPYITWRQRPDGGYTYHVIVRYSDGTSEDPSLLLGMGGVERAADRREEERKLAERLADYITGDLTTTFGPNWRRRWV